MPYKAFEAKKLYYSIGEVAEMLDLSASQIRFWETQFPELTPRKSRKGDRKFTESEIELLRKINQLLKVEGFTIKGAKEALKKKPSQNRVKVTDVELEGVERKELDLETEGIHREILLEVRDSLIQLRQRIKNL